MGSAANFHGVVGVKVVSILLCSSQVFLYQIALFSHSLMLIPV